jgi:hypothetical protein
VGLPCFGHVYISEVWQSFFSKCPRLSLHIFWSLGLETPHFKYHIYLRTYYQNLIFFTVLVRTYIGINFPVIRLFVCMYQ